MKKLNIIDVFIILFVILTLVGVGIRMAANIYLNEKNNTEYIVTVKISSVDSAKENAIVSGDDVYISGVSEAFGRINGIEVQKYFPDTSGGADGVAMDTVKCDILCEIIVRGSKTDNGFLLESGEYLYAGMNLDIKTAGYEGQCLVIGIIDKNQ